MSYIDQALNGGGRLTVSQAIPGKTIFRAVMEWPDGDLVYGQIAMSCQGALDNLEGRMIESLSDQTRALEG